MTNVIENIMQKLSVKDFENLLKKNSQIAKAALSSKNEKIIKKWWHTKQEQVVVLIENEKEWEQLKSCPDVIEYKGQTLYYEKSFYGSNASMNLYEYCIENDLLMFYCSDDNGVGCHVRCYLPKNPAIGNFYR
jgi:hypothetical protein